MPPKTTYAPYIGVEPERYQPPGAHASGIQALAAEDNIFRVSRSGNDIFYDDQTIRIGGTPVVVGGHTVSAASVGLVVDGTKTITLLSSGVAVFSNPSSLSASQTSRTLATGNPSETSTARPRPKISAASRVSSGTYFSHCFILPVLVISVTYFGI